MALLFLEMLQCLGRPNYGNATVAFSIFVAIFLDLREENSDHALTQNTLRLSLFASVILIFFDIWYLIFGGFVSK